MRSLFILFLFLFCLTAGCQQSIVHTPMHFKGLSFVGTPREVSNSDFQPVKEVGANAVAVMPFGYGSIGSPELAYRELEWQWWGESREGAAITASTALKEGLMVMMKPQLWLDWGSFTGDHRLNTEEDWQQFESAYRVFILDYAALSDSLGVQVFCIGTELNAFVDERPAFWSALIQDVRKVFSGALTYAANWDHYPKVSFWNELDYIGVDAYFPLNDARTPSHPALLRGWKNHLESLKAMAEATGKPVVFTEWGYRSVDHCAHKPWDYSGGDMNANMEAQANAYEAFFEAMASTNWYAGGFAWKWFPDHRRSGGANNNRFTPQNKPAEEVLRKAYRRK